MELLILNAVLLYLVTVGISFSSVIKLDLKLFKDLADEGYKINFDKFTEITNSVMPDMKKKALSNFFIPIWNIVYAIKTMENYNFSLNSFYSSLSVMDALEEMSDFEKKEYAKKPTGLNALLVPLRYEQRLNNAVKITIEGQNGKSDIYYDTANKGKEINILKVTGPIKDYSEEELKDIIIESRHAVASIIKKTTEDVLKETLHVNPDEEVDVSKELETFFQNSNSKEQKAFLMELLKNLSEEKETRMKENEEINEPLTLSRKKKDDK